MWAGPDTGGGGGEGEHPFLSKLGPNEKRYAGP